MSKLITSWSESLPRRPKSKTKIRPLSRTFKSGREARLIPEINAEEHPQHDLTSVRLRVKRRKIAVDIVWPIHVLSLRSTAVVCRYQVPTWFQQRSIPRN